MGKRNKNKRNKHKTPIDENPNLQKCENSNETKYRKQFKDDQKVGVPSNSKEVIPIKTVGLKWVSYKELFPTKIVTGAKVIAALKKYDFSKHKENDVLSPAQGQDNILPDNDIMRRVSSKKELVKAVKGVKKPKLREKTKIKGIRFLKDPIFQLRRLSPQEEAETWFPPVPGIDAPLEEGCEVIGNLNKPRPIDPEVKAILDRIPMPTPREIERQFSTKRSVLPRRDDDEMLSNEWAPGELEEALRTRTTSADLKHFYETGELIERN